MMVTLVKTRSIDWLPLQQIGKDSDWAAVALGSFHVVGQIWAAKRRQME